MVQMTLEQSRQARLAETRSDYDRAQDEWCPSGATATAPVRRDIAEGQDRRMLDAELELIRLRPEARTYRFLEIHRANPQMFGEFRRLAHEAKSWGRKYFSADMIYQHMRWCESEKTFGQRASDAPGVEGELKLNNNWRAYLARLLELYEPEFVGFFAVRVRGGRMEGD